MPQHEEKNCPRCNLPFECRVGDISRCGCRNISLRAEVRTLIEEKYSDCLCCNCLKDLNIKQGFFKEKFWNG